MRGRTLELVRVKNMAEYCEGIGDAVFMLFLNPFLLCSGFCLASQFYLHFTAMHPIWTQVTNQ
jgi:hypothetical protein